MQSSGDSQRGTTLVEVLVAIGLMATVGAVFFPVLLSATTGVHRLEEQSRAVDGIRVALGSIARELRSAVCVAEPVAGAAAGPTLRFTTQANNRLYEVSYHVEDGELRRQETGSDERIVTNGVLDTTDTFRTHSSARTAVEIAVRAEPDRGAAPRELRTTVTGRNAWQAC